MIPECLIRPFGADVLVLVGVSGCAHLFLLIDKHVIIGRARIATADSLNDPTGSLHAHLDNGSADALPVRPVSAPLLRPGRPLSVPRGCARGA